MIVADSGEEGVDACVDFWQVGGVELVSEAVLVFFSVECEGK
jgi:hypothetical protein